MTESAATSSSDAAAQRAAEQARLRKERREAKIKAGGSARLNKITGIGGRVTGESDAPEPTATSPAQATSPAAATTHHSGDPDEVDISEHFATAPRNAFGGGMGPEGGMSEAQLHQMMLGFDQGGVPGQQGLGGPGGPPEDDPIMKMMSQMMGGAGGAGGFPGGAFPPGGASPFPGMPGMAGMPGMPAQPVRSDPYTSIWRILHAIVALGLGLYIAILTPFTGTKIERERAAIANEPLDDESEQRKRLFFWTFATAETLLLTTRFFLDKNRAPPTGMLWTVVSYIPEPFRGYIMVMLRYGQIFSTVRADILACMFVLGVCSWWRG